MRLKTAKPRKTLTATSRAECAIVDGEKIVDTSFDLYDGKTSAGELRRYAAWLVKAAKWLEEAE